MSVGLVMCVRDEEVVIERCLRSVMGHIDRWTIVDTGSTDGTPEIVERELAHLPGGLLRDKWVDFGTNRTRALELARGGADYLLMMDADMTLDAAGPLPALEEPVYEIQVDDGDCAYGLPALVRGDLDWRVEGVTHEHLVGNGFPATPACPLYHWRLTHHCDGARRPAKLEDDLALLLAEVERAGAATARQAFYLAQTYRILGRVDDAVAWYRTRLCLGGWDEEIFYSHYQLGVLLCEHTGVLKGFPHLVEAYRMRPGRAEPLRMLAGAASSVADKMPQPTGLFVHADCYRQA